MTAPGAKFDTDKDPWDLLPWCSVAQVVKVLAFGAKKYCPDGWRAVPGARDRYFAATIRHLVAWKQGSPKDPESGLNHLSHAACCLLFLLWYEREDVLAEGH